MIKRFFLIASINISLLLISLPILLVYYNYNQQMLDVLTPKNEYLIRKLKSDIVLRYNVTAYNRLRTLYVYKSNEGEFLIYSLIIANKNHYPQAYFDIYHGLKFIDNLPPHNISNTYSTKLMITYLMKAVSLNHKQSVYELGKLYLQGKYVSQDSILGEKLINSSGFLKGHLLH